MKILVINGHPGRESYCHALADAYASGAAAAGAEVRRLNVGALQFDPVLHEGYRQIQPLEPDLGRARDVDPDRVSQFRRQYVEAGRARLLRDSARASHSYRRVTPESGAFP